MKKLGGIGFLFFSRGVSKFFRRLMSIKKRFSFLPGKQMGIIRQFADCLKAYGIRGTFFIPAILLERYASHLKGIDPKIVEWGIHGYVHTDHSGLDYDQQKAQMTKAAEIFDRCGFAFKGFRCPYLRFNEHTANALMATGRFEYDSSHSIVWEELYGPGRKHYSWIKDFYKALAYKKNSAMPFIIGKLSEIPVSLPDDDISLDRESLNQNEIFDMWCFMLKTCHRNNEVFVLQLHPERFLELKDTLIRLIEEAKSLHPAIRFARLSEVANKNKNNTSDEYQGVFCITGDIDAITIQDFFTRLKEW